MVCRHDDRNILFCICIHKWHRTKKQHVHFLWLVTSEVYDTNRTRISTLHFWVSMRFCWLCWASVCLVLAVLLPNPILLSKRLVANFMWRHMKGGFIALVLSYHCCLRATCSLGYHFWLCHSYCLVELVSMTVLYSGWLYLVFHFAQAVILFFIIWLTLQSFINEKLMRREGKPSQWASVTHTSSGLVWCRT